MDFGIGPSLGLKQHTVNVTIIFIMLLSNTIYWISSFQTCKDRPARRMQRMSTALRDLQYSLSNRISYFTVSEYLRVPEIVIWCFKLAIISVQKRALHIESNMAMARLWWLIKSNAWIGRLVVPMMQILIERVKNVVSSNRKWKKKLSCCFKATCPVLLWSNLNFARKVIAQSKPFFRIPAHLYLVLKLQTESNTFMHMGMHEWSASCIGALVGQIILNLNK